MPIPDFQSIMLPLLILLSDKKERSNQEITSELAHSFELTDEEMNQLLPSGVQKIFVNRVAWAKAYLKRALLISSPKRGFSVITDRGLNVLKENPNKINIKYLERFPEILEFRKKSIVEPPAVAIDGPIEGKTPEEYIEYGFQSVLDDLSKELLQKIKECAPPFLERLS